MADAFITIGGLPLPWPDYSSGLQTISTLVDGGRNGEGVFIGQRVGRDQSKVELGWSCLDADTWAAVLRKFDTQFDNEVEYFDAVTAKKITRRMYVSDRSQRPLRVDGTGNVLTWTECKLNLIDTGE